MKPQQFCFQSHECDGYRAKVTIEWELPEDVEFALLPPQRRADTEEIADAIASFAFPRVRNMVMAMRGYSSSTQPPQPKG